VFSSAAIAGIILPIAMRRLFVQYGFGWAIRILAFLSLGSLIIANILLRPRTKPDAVERKLFDFGCLKELRFLLLCAAVFFAEMAVFPGYTYLGSYALAQGISPNLSYIFMTFIGVGSTVGRIIPGFAADIIGP
jgi:predicted MFS family arabinose efflux permease